MKGNLRKMNDYSIKKGKLNYLQIDFGLKGRFKA